VTVIFNTMCTDENPFKRQCEKRRHEGLRISNFALLLVVFKRRDGSEGVKRIILLSVMF